ncbi:MAG TPA: UvrD-helicase domain-containing protein, partial [Candidatus Omnitrophota bacterium]|nr:UvrD-helicase domain-containing protein [Candidatus Omnitrophota bacterium]
MEKHITMPVLTSDLTLVQRKAVETVDRNVCVSAGAGTGKTRVLVERFIYLVEHEWARPHEILAVTFTEKAAQEMKRRIAARLRESGLEDARRELENAYIGTIHSFCARVLREHPIEAGVDPDFRVLEEDEAHLLRELAFDELIEARFQEPGIFNLLHVYGEQTLRSGVSSVARKVHTSGLTLDVILSPSPAVILSEAKNLAGSRVNSAKDLRDSSVFDLRMTSEVLKTLVPLKRIKGKENDCAEIEALLSKPVSGWREIEAVKTAAKKFQRRGDDQKAFRDALDEWLGFR